MSRLLIFLLLLATLHGPATAWADITPPPEPGHLIHYSR